jgi:hypothetical protein
MNWWNWMETVFGATFGAVLGLGVWMHRDEIRPSVNFPKSSLHLLVEVSLAVLHIALLTAGSFFDQPLAEWYQEYGLVFVTLPIVAIAGGRLWPWLIVFPITLIPIAGKTVYRFEFEEAAIASTLAWLLLLIVPLVAASLAAVWAYRCSSNDRPAAVVLPQALLLTTWIYFGLNFAFCDFPWPWTAWTSRTPNSLVFTFCALGLTAGAMRIRRAYAEHLVSVPKNDTE